MLIFYHWQYLRYNYKVQKVSISSLQPPKNYHLKQHHSDTFFIWLVKKHHLTGKYMSFYLFVRSSKHRTYTNNERPIFFFQDELFGFAKSVFFSFPSTVSCSCRDDLCKTLFCLRYTLSKNERLLGKSLMCTH
jgi:hypothetical protein